VWIWQPGFYFVHINIHHIQPCQNAIFKNGLPVIAGTFASPTGSSQNSHSVIIEILPEDIIFENPFVPLASFIQLVNHTSYAPLVELDGSLGAGSALPSVLVTMSIILLSPTGL
jgi:hypothetical protein